MHSLSDDLPEKEIAATNGDIDCTMKELNEKLHDISRILPHIPPAHLLTVTSGVRRIRYRNCSRANATDQVWELMTREAEHLLREESYEGNAATEAYCLCSDRGRAKLENVFEHAYILQGFMEEAQVRTLTHFMTPL